MPLRASQAHIDRILKQKEHFLRVQAATGVPWEALGAIWYREGLHLKPPSTPGGPWQFDPLPGYDRMKFLLSRYSNLGVETREKLICDGGVMNFWTGAYLAACHARHRCTPEITPEASDEDIKDLFWGYNGKAKYHRTADGSPYVMSGYDKAHDGMLIVGSIPDKKNPGKRVRIKTTDKRPGAFVVFKQLKGEI